MNKTEEMLKFIDASDYQKSDAYNIRSNGKLVDRKVSPYINIETKNDKNGINVYIKDDTKFGIVHIPVIITKSGLKDVVYNDFYIGKNANVIILAGCGIHNDLHKDSEHDGIHRFFLSENAKVKYVEKHYGEGKGSGKKTLNPVTEIYMKPNSSMTIDSSQFKGVDDTLRVTKAYLDNNTTLTINEKIFTNNSQNAKSEFLVELNGENASTKITSRSIATEDSYQEFKSNIIGNINGLLPVIFILLVHGQLDSLHHRLERSIAALCGHFSLFECLHIDAVKVVDVNRAVSEFCVFHVVNGIDFQAVASLLGRHFHYGCVSCHNRVTLLVSLFQAQCLYYYLRADACGVAHCDGEYRL